MARGHGRNRRGHGAEVDAGAAQRALRRGEVDLHVDDHEGGAAGRDPGFQPVLAGGGADRPGSRGVHAVAILRPGRMSAPNIFSPST